MSLTASLNSLSVNLVDGIPSNLNYLLQNEAVIFQCVTDCLKTEVRPDGNNVVFLNFQKHLYKYYSTGFTHCGSVGE